MNGDLIWQDWPLLMGFLGVSFDNTDCGWSHEASGYKAGMYTNSQDVNVSDNQLTSIFTLLNCNEVT